MKKLAIAALAATTLASAVAPTMANNGYSEVPTITKEVTVGGQTTTLRIDPSFKLSGGQGFVQLGVKATIDASDLQRDLPGQINGRKKYDECGTRFYLKDATIRPAGGGKALIGITAQAQQWHCVKTKVPKTYFKVKKTIFGIKTKVPVIKWKIDTFKTKLVSQSARIEALVWPSISGGHAQANVQVTKAAPSGLLGGLVKTFGVEGKIRSLAQKEVNKALKAKGRMALPAEFDRYKVKVQNASFVDIGGGKLGLNLSATGKATQAQLAELIADTLTN